MRGYICNTVYTHTKNINIKQDNVPGTCVVVYINVYLTSRSDQ